MAKAWASGWSGKQSVDFPLAEGKDRLHIRADFKFVNQPPQQAEWQGQFHPVGNQCGVALGIKAVLSRHNL